MMAALFFKDRFCLLMMCLWGITGAVKPYPRHFSRLRRLGHSMASAALRLLTPISASIAIYANWATGSLRPSALRTTDSMTAKQARGLPADAAQEGRRLGVMVRAQKRLSAQSITD